MTALLKYEFRKTLMTKLFVLGITLVAETVFLVGNLLGNSSPNGEMTTSIGILLLVLTALGGILMISVQSVVTLHRDMNTKQGYMLFMTPNSSYRILGAKMIENVLSVYGAGILFFLLGIVDVSILFARLGQLERLANYVSDLLRSLNFQIEFTAKGFLIFAFASLSSWIGTITIAFLSDIISSALFNGRKFNGFLTFALFIGINFLMGAIMQAIPKSFDPNTSLLISGITALIFSAIMYFLSSVIMDRYLSV